MPPGRIESRFLELTSTSSRAWTPPGAMASRATLPLSPFAGSSRVSFYVLSFCFESCYIDLPGTTGKAATNPAVVRVQMMEDTFMLAVDEVGLSGYKREVFFLCDVKMIDD